MPLIMCHKEFPTLGSNPPKKHIDTTSICTTESKTSNYDVKDRTTIQILPSPPSSPGRRRTPSPNSRTPLAGPQKLPGSLAMLQRILGPLSSSCGNGADRTPFSQLDDVTFVSLDFEFFQNKKTGLPVITQVGTTSVRSKGMTQANLSSYETTAQFWITQRSGCASGPRFEAAQRQFAELHFEADQQELVPQRELFDVLNEIFHVEDLQRSTKTKKAYHKVVLVGHQFDSEIRILNSLGFNWGTNDNIIGYIDTIDIAREVHGLRFTPSLKAVLDMQRIAYSGEALHIAACDANYTLQAMFSLGKYSILDQAAKALNTREFLPHAEVQTSGLRSSIQQLMQMRVDSQHLAWKHARVQPLAPWY